MACEREIGTRLVPYQPQIGAMRTTLGAIFAAMPANGAARYRAVKMVMRSTEVAAYAGLFGQSVATA